MIPILFPYIEGSEVEWIELNLLRHSQPISKATIIAQIPQPDDTDDFNEILEERVDSWLSELVDRNYNLATSFYELKGNTIYPNYSWLEYPEYFLCLYFSYAGASKDPIGTKLFERISANTIKNFIGGEIFTFGFPSTKNLNEFLDEVAPVCFEERGSRANNDYKDDGVDVLCYKSFDDNKSSNLYVLLQCAAGNNWKNKSPIHVERWTRYIQWSSRNILTSISTTDYVSERQWPKSASDYGILLDRNRIINWYIKSIDVILRKEVIIWCSDKVA